MTASTVASAEAAEHTIVLPGAVALPRPRPASDPVAVLPALGLRRRRAARVSSVRLSRVAAFVIPRWPLFAVLAVVTVLAGHLIMTNTAFVDEANYLSAGQVEWQHWLHGGPSVNYSTYFSGSPQIYPPLAAAADAIGGLALARAMSLVFMLVTISLLYGTARRLFDRRTAGWAVAVFATVDGTQFLGAFATYDAMSLMLVALAVWVAVRFAQSGRAYPHAGLLLGVPLLALANATKYASGLFDPVVITVVGFAVASRYGRRLGVRAAVTFAAMLAAVLCAAVAIAGHRYEIGISATTLSRATGTATTSQVLGQAVRWIGWLAALSALAMVVCVVMWRRGRRHEDRRSVIAAAPVLTLLLAATVALAPIEQARIHTTVSLHKHVTFGGWFAAIAVGAMFATLSGPVWRKWWRWAPVLTVVTALLVIGRGQAAGSFQTWPNTTRLMASMAPYVAATADKPVLMDGSEVARYYLGSRYPVWHWANTYYLQYQPPGSTKLLFGEEAFRSAIRHDYFGVVAFNQLDESYWMNGIVEQAIAKNSHYHYLGRVYIHDSAGAGWYALWLDRTPEAAE